MTTRSYLSAAALVLVFVTGSDAQYPLLDKVAAKVVQKFEQSTCDQLLARKGQPKSAEEQQVVEFLRKDPARREAFLNRVAAPIANKMFECGLIP
uniref:Secreted protein n=1 Tax=Solibacter usitatus (strain Ellin6076) TaxID=234267 RepID=Q01VF1_SOLUE